MVVSFGIGPLISSCCIQIGKCILPDDMEKHFAFLFKYNETFKNLEKAEERLDAMRKEASHSAEDINETMQKNVRDTATLWMKNVDELLPKARIILSRKDNMSCLNQCSCYSSCKRAWETAKEINEKIQNPPDFTIVFNRPTQKLGAKFELELRGRFMKFKSRESVLEKVWEVLKNKKVRMCSICGMGGTGKTWLVKNLVQRVETEKLFGYVAMAVVSEQPTSRKIRNDIMSSLKWEFKSEELETSNKLYNSLLNSSGKEILLILDDVWGELNFEEIGIPKESLTILLTSRNIEECQGMGSDPNFVINALAKQEARDMFEAITMKSTKNWTLPDIGSKIADECGGLPIIIAPLAAALKHQGEATWNDTLHSLLNLSRLGIKKLDQVYSRIYLSYDLLKDPEAQAVFRLCCLFPEDQNISVEYLIWYAKGLQIFKTKQSMKETSDRVKSIIERLKKLFLLLDGDHQEDGSAKMHDILRDFAILMSKKDKFPYIVMENWPDSNPFENSIAISLVRDKIKKHPPVDLSCPELELLYFGFHEDEVELPIGILDMLIELKVVFLKVPSLLQSLSKLTKLRTLVIYETSNAWNRDETADIGNLLGHGDLKNLEILNFFSTRPCYDFPTEIGQLFNLRCLKFGQVEFKYMPPDLLSKLVQLEELELSMKFSSWGRKEEGGDRVNATLDEIKSLPLYTLKINVGKGSILPKKLVKIPTRFLVYMGSYLQPLWGYKSNAVLEVYNVDVCDVRESWISGLLSQCDWLRLTQVSNLKNIMCLVPMKDRIRIDHRCSDMTIVEETSSTFFSRLKDIRITSCNEMEYLVDTTIGERISSTLFSQLQTFTLSRMDGLKEIWHSSYYLSNIEPRHFSNLSDITIFRCPKLKHLFPLSVATELRHLQSIDILACEEMEAIFYRDQVDDDQNQVASSSTQLITPTVEITSARPICPKPNFSIRSLLGRHKQKKMVSTPQIMEESIGKVDHAIMDPIIVFPELKTLQLRRLEELRIFYDGNHTIKLPSLENLKIQQCDKLRTMSHGSFATPALKGLPMINDGGVWGDHTRFLMTMRVQDIDDKKEAFETFLELF